MSGSVLLPAGEGGKGSLCTGVRRSQRSRALPALGSAIRALDSSNFLLKEDESGNVTELLCRGCFLPGQTKKGVPHPTWGTTTRGGVFSMSDSNLEGSFFSPSGNDFSAHPPVDNSHLAWARQPSELRLSRGGGGTKSAARCVVSGCRGPAVGTRPGLENGGGLAGGLQRGTLGERQQCA